MNIDLGLIASVLTTGNFLRCREKGLSSENIEGDVIPVWKFVEEYYEQYRSTPSKKIVEDRFGLLLEEPKESIDFWIAEVKKRSLFDNINSLFMKMQPLLNKSDPVAAYDEMRNFIKGEEKSLIIESPISSLASLKQAVLDKYMDAKSGKFGILTPWKTMNEWTTGWYPKDLSFIVARSGIGKTFLAIHIASFAKRNKVPTLFITGEMSREDVAARDFAIEFKIQYQSMRKGRLSFIEEERLKKAMQEYQPEVDMDIMDGSQGMHIDDIERVFERTKAKLIVVDATYRIRARQKTRDRFENMAYVADDLKQFSQVYDKAVVATTQFNRDAAKKKGSPGMEDVALSDVINWNATNVFSMKVSDDKEYMEVFPLKVREGENMGESMKLRWDFVSMNFDELDQSQIAPKQKDYTDTDKDDDFSETL